ncbi:YtzH-like family protein [Texcoconibacillus texcoconensis]|uniref:YtzH-like protein n=1 Tax=Texcoconibacillus texcoconensis TaxID=1095777 RepID=A0A840QN37_9BACI|nr:YtzH-like family protein [Texcoconibacillus texcoconensis]MBB5172795.1 hypothetical protein [Texcoconibacillus texcoconensis]
MPMNEHHQLQLLMDILTNQQQEHFGTHDELVQMEQLASSLLKKDTVDDELKPVLMAIEQYCHQHLQTGEQQLHSTEEISQWHQAIFRHEQANHTPFP